ncbi:nucleotidyl transferase AbiEii/AbiGii toxin family protein [Chitinophaga oryziterrae]|nr:nucleotidyl transferase AbiEii/AbiGii toxin family protein [Chitinophaga oryziterrae]
MSLENIREIKEGDLKEIFDALEEAFVALEIDFYLIGAIARDVWFSRANKAFRKSKDVDFAILVGSHEEYDALRAYLKKYKDFQDTKDNSFVMLTPTGIQIDILPFGGIEIDSDVKLDGVGFTSIRVNGFSEVHKAGTADVTMQTGHAFKVATLPAIVLLKLIAFDDRPEKRHKDPGDISNIIAHYFEMQSDLIYNEHNDLFITGQLDKSLEQIAGIVIGREIKKIIAENGELTQRVSNILTRHSKEEEKSVFIRQMVAETGTTVREMVVWIKAISSGLME